MNYEEFVNTYGDRPKDIVYNMAVKLERERLENKIFGLFKPGKSGDRRLTVEEETIRQTLKEPG